MKNIFYILLIISFCSCSHKIGSVVTSETKSDSLETFHSDTSTELSIDTTKLPPVFVHDTINFDSFCDSLKNGFFPQIKTEKIYIHTTSKGVSPIACKTDSLEQIVERQNTVIVNQHDKIKSLQTTIHQTDTVKQSFLSDIWFWVAVSLVLVVVILIRRK